MKTIGLDGCRAGWIAISLDEDNAGYWLIETDEDFEVFIEKYDRIFIDVPIGLEQKKYVRECDRLLRDRLGPGYYASVFNPPVRPALHAPTYGEASMTSFEITGKKISIQAWNITPNIKLMDRLLQKKEAYRDKVFESHPELLFQILHGGSSILQKKATKKGIRHRLELLKKVSKFADDFFRDIKEEFRRNQVDEDDILDAMVLAEFALRSIEHDIQSLPENPPEDETGLQMAVHFV